MFVYYASSVTVNGLGSPVLLNEKFAFLLSFARCTRVSIFDIADLRFCPQCASKVYYSPSTLPVFETIDRKFVLYHLIPFNTESTRKRYAHLYKSRTREKATSWRFLQAGLYTNLECYINLTPPTARTLVYGAMQNPHSITTHRAVSLST